MVSVLLESWCESIGDIVEGDLTPEVLTFTKHHVLPYYGINNIHLKKQE